VKKTDHKDQDRSGQKGKEVLRTMKAGLHVGKERYDLGMKSESGGGNSINRWRARRGKRGGYGRGGSSKQSQRA